MKHNNTNNDNNDSITKESAGTIVNFFNAIVQFGHLLCIDKYGHHVINTLLKLCQQFKMIDILKKFTQKIVIKNFLLLIEYRRSCQLIQNMINSHLHQIKFFFITQLKIMFQAAENQQPTIQQSNSGEHRRASVPPVVNRNNTDKKPPLVRSTPFSSDEKSKSVIHESKVASGTSDFDHVKNDYEQLQLIYRTMTHKYGNKIIEAMIDASYEPDLFAIILYIYHAVNKKIKYLSCDKFGCNVVQSCIVSKNCDYKNKTILFANIFKLLPCLCNHKYGHICVAKCIQTEHEDDWIKKSFIDQILFYADVKINNLCHDHDSNTYTLPTDLKKVFINNMLNVQNAHTIINFSKFGFGEYSYQLCNIAFQHASFQQQKQLIVYLCNPNISNKLNVLFGLIHHKYGNIVIDNIIKTLIDSKQKHLHVHSHCNCTCSNMFDQLEQTLNRLFQVTPQKHNENSFAHNIICTILQNNKKAF